MAECSVCKSEFPDEARRKLSPRDLTQMEPTDERAVVLHSVATSIVMFDNPPGGADIPMYWICLSCWSQCFSRGGKKWWQFWRPA